MWSRSKKEKEDKGPKEDEIVVPDEDEEKKENPEEMCDNSSFSNSIEKKRKTMLEMKRTMLLPNLRLVNMLL